MPGALFAGTPWADLTKTGDSYFTNEGVDNILVTYEGILEGSAKLYAGDHALTDPLISPVYGDFKGFPPTYLVSGTRDMFLSNTVRVHRKLRTAGVEADLNVYESLSHGEYLAVIESPESQQVFAELGEFLLKNLRNILQVKRKLFWLIAERRITLYVHFWVEIFQLFAFLSIMILHK